MLATLLAFACLPASAYDRYGNRAMQGSTPTPAVAPLCVTSANPGCNSSTTALTPAYVPSTNRLISAWADYDAAGNMLAFKDPIGAGTRDWSAFYDAENKQRFYCDGTTATCSASNDTAEYVYDGEGNRVKKIAASETVTYVYDAFGRLAAEYSTAGPSGTAGSYFRTTDHLGSTRLVTDGSGAVHDRRDLFPFGEQIADSYSNRSSAGDYNESNPASAHLFTGKERDQESGLDYFGARYMASALGRFTSADGPFMDQSPGDPRSWNLYSYTRNNPLRYVDSSGNFIETLWDVANVILDVKSLADNVSEGNYGAAALDAGGLIADTAAVLIPGVPGGAGTAIKLGRAGDKLNDIGKSADKAGDAASAAKKVPDNPLGGKALGEVDGPKIGSTDGPGSGKRFSEGTKDAAEAQAGGQCVFCGTTKTRTPGPDQRNTDHAVPKSRGGDNSLDNAQNACRACNLKKSAQTTEEFLDK